jgi:peptidoglycan/LPS O-acetylase OafA/YrhL
VSLFLILLGIVIPVNVWFLAKELLLFSAYSWFGILVLAFSKLKNPPKKSIVTTILKVLGESSYPIYLFHLIILGFFSRFFASATLVNFVFFYLINLAFSLLVIKYLEPGVKALISRCLKFS